MAKNISTIKIDEISYTTRPYGTCSTAANATAKAVTDCSDFSLGTGAIILVKFTYSNTAASATLNVNSTGAKKIYYNGSELTAAISWPSGSIVEFYYDGTYWNIISMIMPNASSTIQGIVSTNDQTFSGKKTFNNGISVPSDVNLEFTVPSDVNLEFNTPYIKYNSISGCLEISC